MDIKSSRVVGQTSSDRITRERSTDSEELFGEMRSTGDPAADLVVAKLFESGSVTAMNELLSTLLRDQRAQPVGNLRGLLSVDWSMDRPTSSESRPKSFRPGLLVWFLVALAMGALGWHLVFSRNIEAFTMEEQGELANQAIEWVRAQRQARRPFASPLAPSELEIFGPYFPRPVLEDSRVLAVAEMPSPRFVGALRHRGKKIFDFSQALGLALGDTILLRGANVPAGSPARRSVLFHELVHSVQYRALGVESCLENYFASLVAAEYRYPDIVFERQAFDLQQRFMVHPDQPFSVALEVERLVAQLNQPN